MQWRVLVPIKHGAPAKTRLRPATGEQDRHAELVRAIQLDTLDAVLALQAHPLLGGLFIVSGGVSGEPSGPPALPAGIEVLPDAGGGLNPALAAAAAELARRFPADGVVALVADLPALRPADLLAVLRGAPATGRSFVRDLDGSGTTLLAAGPGEPLAPLFGPGSAQRHLDSGALELDAAASLRCDVDSAADLRRCLELGVGTLTSRLVAHLV
ncbi:MAG TPA: 2-phospho-L-lactate guanylyltransferase [Jatrophihabitans sp.]|uniref:2-phospho-L-lactate guanylyltransferase n=1 Tax=Jatrophihabitans sp. TaxID=1932789 RepID=UPI002EE67624